MISIQPITPELLNAERMVLIPVCPTLGDFTNYLNGYCQHHQKDVINAWADLQTWGWKNPQNTKFN